MQGPPNPEMRSPADRQVDRAKSQNETFSSSTYHMAFSLDQGQLVSAVVEISRERSEPLRFPRFGANGLYPGRRSEPSPIRSDQVLTAMMFLRMFTPTKLAYFS